MSTIRELKAQASELHIKNYGRMTKSELEAAILQVTQVEETVEVMVEETVEEVTQVEETLVETQEVVTMVEVKKSHTIIRVLMYTVAIIYALGILTYRFGQICGKAYYGSRVESTVQAILEAPETRNAVKFTTRFARTLLELALLSMKYAVLRVVGGALIFIGSLPELLKMEAGSSNDIFADPYK